MMKMKRSAKGFSSFELAVVIVLIAIVGGIGFFYVQGIVEQMRMSEVASLMSTEVAAQDRFYLTQHRYARAWHQLDTAPVQVRRAREDNRYSNGSQNTIYYTRGKKQDGTPAPGFKVYFEEGSKTWYVVAERVSSDKYQYTLVRPFNLDKVYCLPANLEEANQQVCMEFMNLDSPSDLPTDPRL